MEIRCENCNTKLNIPDEKIPHQGQRVTISCPKCKGKLTLDARVTKTEDPSPAVNKKAAPEARKADPVRDEAEGIALEYNAEGLKLALVAESDPDRFKKIGQAIRDLGYKCVAAENTNQAISKMRFHAFDLVILSNKFDGIELGQSPILQYMNHLSMSIRRKMFVVLIGDTYNTMDHMMAFAMSANLVINRRDSDKLEGILKNAISDNEKFYKVFLDTLSEVGKA
jgi:predicted Zn finger-like uncharacterized protein